MTNGQIRWTRGWLHPRQDGVGSHGISSYYLEWCARGFPDGSVINNPPASVGDGVQSLIQEDPICQGAMKSRHHNFWGYAPEPRGHDYQAHMLQLLKPSYRKACALKQEKRENGIETCVLSYVNRSPVQVRRDETGCSGLVHWDDPEGWGGVGGGRGVQDGEHMNTHGWFMSMYGKTTTILSSN